MSNTSSVRRGGPQVIPRPAVWRPCSPPLWEAPPAITVADVSAALAARRAAPERPAGEVAAVADPGIYRRPAAVLCALFDEAGQAHVVLTRRSSRLRSHTHQVAFPGGRLDPGESLLAAALREAQEEVGIEPSDVQIVGRLTPLRTVVNPAPITPFVGTLPGRPVLVPNPAEVERAFTVPLLELLAPDVFRCECWTLPDGTERPMHFFELVGDTVWGATARILVELLELTVGWTGQPVP
ncbi:MAG TPA: CoA pyrophosphatase [Acidimicrobiales bacterium]|nr:CoA pyrophosphatase [Acidimicrobiales bacterium]